MTSTTDQPPASGPELAARLAGDVATLDRELAEIDMLIGQARAEAARHEQRRAQAVEKLDPSTAAKSDPKEAAEAWNQLVTLTKRAVLMEAQVDVLEGKRRALGRHREAVAAIGEVVGGVEIKGAPTKRAGGRAAEADGDADGGADAGGSSMSRVVLSAQEDLRREIARSMHDGPAQSLTNIVLQAQIVERLVDRDPARANVELKQLVSMVQQTLDATKNFIFDVRPMVLDDLGLVPTLRRAARDRGRRAHVPVEFESLGQDRRLPMDLESAVFRIVDEALAGYLGQGPEKASIRLDWGEELEARVVATRIPAIPVEDEPLPEVPTGKDVPDAIRQMIQDRHDARAATIAAAEQAAIVVQPQATRRELADRAAAIGASLEFIGGGGEVRVSVPLPSIPAEDGGEPAIEAEAGEA